MTNEEEIFQTLLQWAYAFGCDIIEADKEDFPKNVGEARGFFNVVKSGIVMKREDVEIWLISGLSLEEKIWVLAHETGHLILYLLGIRPYVKELHEPVAVLIERFLIALLKGEQDDPVLQIDCSGEVLKMIQKFLKLLQEKQDRTQESIFKIDQAYFKFKKDQERELIEKG